MRFICFTSIFFLIINTSTNLLAKESWILDKELSSIEFELPVLFAKNVKGKFNEIEGLIEINPKDKSKNKAIFSVKIESIDMNYKKYKNLLLSDIFFGVNKFPFALIDTKKFSYTDEKEIVLNVELFIKGQNKDVPLKIQIFHLAEELVQIKSTLIFSRTDFSIGVGTWSSTAILKDKALIKTNLFLFKE